jgi:flagellum-specific peptidoglycan hydrolase FlgJ
MKKFKAYLEEAANQEYFNTRYQSIRKYALDAGLSADKADQLATVGASQSSLETSFGKYRPRGPSGEDSHNYYGIKGKGPAGSFSARTREVIDGKDQYRQEPFKAYNQSDESDRDFVHLMTKNKRYQPVIDAPDLPSAIAAQGKSGYSTAQIAGPLSQIANKYASGISTAQQKPQAASKDPNFETGTQRREPDSYKQQEPDSDYPRELELPQKSYASDSASDPNVGKRQQFLKPQRTSRTA